ncbi:four helix bundle protein [Galbibacter sp. EGI 63066]|uniref:four helix bundle protein n=1 Tax=Galbibacter sp. EGI 63066 TaxID=2993559 RepID=UPI0022498F10|nr:four helix bundle protein [Galbibacter sp. EGI 63066]MCX2678600.1 four helix bundle protein [Galbibacter sp. EGI 63066]
MENIKRRTQDFAVDCWKLCDKLPNTRGYNAYCNQLIKCSSSVGANFRASQRAKSTADFINKLKIVEEEADESMYFLELLGKVSPKYREEIKVLHKEADEILSIIVASINTTRKKRSRER